jgi:GTP-binding nuclear protein Ran
MKLKVVVAGDGGVGKTSYINRIVDAGPFDPRYIATIGVDIKNTQFGPDFEMDFWDTAGPEKYGGLRDRFYVDAHAFIIMFDLSSRPTYKNVPNWYRDATRVTGTDVPIILCGNKVDLPEEELKVAPKTITFHRKKNIPYFETSCKTKHNIDLPILVIRNWYSKHFYIAKGIRRPQLLIDCRFHFE